MIDINLLNTKKVNDSDSDFFDIDETLINKVNMTDKAYDDKNAKQIIESKQDMNINGKSFFGLLFIFILLIVGPYFYYHFSDYNKADFYSQNIERMIYLVLDDENMELLNFNFDKKGLNIEVVIDDSYFPEVKEGLKKQIYRIGNSGMFKLERFDDILAITYPHPVDIVNIKYDPNLNIEDYRFNNQNNISKDALSEILYDFFKTNNPKLSNFQIKTSYDNNYSYYDIIFIK